MNDTSSIERDILQAEIKRRDEAVQADGLLLIDDLWHCSRSRSRP